MPTNTTNSAFPWILDLQYPLWLLTIFVPLGLGYLYLARRRRRIPVRYTNQAMEQATLGRRRERELSRHLGALALVLSMLPLIVLAARPEMSAEAGADQSLITWVIDTSQSMETTDVNNAEGQQVSRLEGVIEALNQTIDQAPPNTFRQLVTFSDRNNIVTHKLTKDPQQLAAQIEQLAGTELTRSTATEAGLLQATENCIRSSELVELYGSHNMPCVIILLSDGECDNQPFCVDETVEVAAKGLARGMKIHTVSWGNPDGDRTSVFLPEPEAMQRIADAGGGQHLETADTDRLVQLYQQALQQVETATVSQGISMDIVWAARIIFGLLALSFGFGYLTNHDLLIVKKVKK